MGHLGMRSVEIPLDVLGRRDETAYLLEGEVTVTPDDTSLPAVTLKAGDYVLFPKDMSCTWDVTKAINKHFNFG
jgi:uncharacterized cupin superfamily protein